MTRTLPRGLVPLVLAVLAAMEIVALSGAVPAPHLVLSPHRASPFMAGVLAIPFLVHMRARPRRGEMVATIAVAAVIAALSGGLKRPLIVAGTSLGFASLIVLAARALFARERRREARDALSVGVVFPAFFMSMVTGLALTVVLHPATYDGALFHVDGALGGAPSFAVGRWFAAWPVLALVCEVVYRGIPLAAGVLLVVRPNRPEAASPARMLSTFVASGILGFGLYHLCPAVGPGYAFRAQFPSTVPVAASVSIAPFVVAPFDRNCVPSLHTTWALFLLWFSRGRGPWMRGGASIWLGCTLLATLGLGEHYVVDLVIAVPFAVGVHALGAIDLPLSRRERWVPIAVGVVLTAVWIVAIRRASSVLAASAPPTWALVIVSIALPLTLHRALVRALDSAERAPNVTAEPAKATPLFAVSVAALFLLGAAATIDLVIAYRSAQLATGFAPSTRLLAAACASAALGAFSGKRLDDRGGATLRTLAYCALGIGAVGAAAPRYALLPLSFLVALPFPAIGARLSPSAVIAAATMGGAFGAIAGVSLFLPQLGMALSTLPALVLALIAALICLRASRSDTGAIERATDPCPKSWFVTLLAASLIAPAIFVSFEDRLARAAGDSVYTSAFALTAILLGLAAGASGARPLFRILAPLAPLRFFSPGSASPSPIALGGLAVALVVTALACVPSIPDLERYFAAFENYKAVRDFSGHALVRFFVIAAVLVPPAAVAGALLTTALPRHRSFHPAAALLAAAFGMLILGLGRAPRSIDPTDLQTFPAAARLTREGLARTKSTLPPGQPAELVLDLDRISEDDLVAILATIQAELPSITIHVSGARATLFACPAECSPPPPQNHDFALTPTETKRIVAARTRVTTGSLVITEDDLRLLWSVPRARVVPRGELLRANLRVLRAPEAR